MLSPRLWSPTYTEHQAHNYSHETQVYYRYQDILPDTKEQKRWSLETSLQWGSDPSFCYHGFHNPVETWTEKRVTQSLMRNMMHAVKGVSVDFGYDFDFFMQAKNLLSEPPEGIHSNRPDLPDNLQTDTPMKKPYSRPAPLSMATLLGESSPAEMTIEEKPARQKEVPEPPKKKRKYIQKPGQQSCHSRSEKKRREAVTKGYQDLSDLVPGLKNHNFTRKYRLDEVAKYVSALLQGNEELKERLKEM